MKFSVLVAARKNSKYLAKFLFGLTENTARPSDMEVLVMCSSHDTWNRELIHFFQDLPRNITFYFEDKGLGRAGLHEYFNELYRYSSGDWIAYFCDDHFINETDWDNKVRRLIRERGLRADDIWCLIPKFDNVGAMNQILSRGYVSAMGGYLGRHGNIDSYINDVNAQLPGERIIRFDDEWFHDFSHDDPSPMHGSHSQSVITPEGKELARHLTASYESNVAADAAKLKGAIK